MVKLISVIVPAYNECKYIAKCLQSVKAQTYRDVEIIVIDDGSNDSTQEIARKFTKFVYPQKHLGAAEARNLGARRAVGEILVFIDADMVLDKNYIEKLTKPIISRKARATFTKEEYIANPENIWVSCFNIDNNLNPKRRMSDNYPDRDTKFRAIMKELFEEIGGYKTNFGYGEDEILKEKEAISAKGAICYHYNPETLQEVFLSARWMGRSKNIPRTFSNILKYSLINSLNISIHKIQKGAPLQFIIYKFIFDLGMLNGILYKSHNEK